MNRTVVLAAVLWPLALPAVSLAQPIRTHPARIVHARTTTFPTGAISDEQVCMDRLGATRRELDVNDREDIEFEPMIDQCIAMRHQRQ